MQPMENDQLKWKIHIRINNFDVEKKTIWRREKKIYAILKEEVEYPKVLLIIKAMIKIRNVTWKLWFKKTWVNDIYSQQVVN